MSEPPANPTRASGVRIAAMSDFHGHLAPPDEMPGSDLLVIAGDICPIADHSPLAQHRWLEREFRPWLEHVPAGHVVGIAGNHDLIFARTQEPFVPDLPWHYLQDSEVELCGLRIYGTPWIPYMRAGAGVFQAPSSFGGEFLRERYSGIPAGIDILISHAPPFGLHDAVGLDEGLVRGRHHTGSKALASAIRRTRPRLVVCGHVHERRGASGFGSYNDWTLVANVSLMNWDYQPCYEPMQFLMPQRPEPTKLLRRS
jgi:hypothetical protein